MILRAAALCVILASGGLACARSPSVASSTPPPRVMLSALLHTDTLSAQLLTRVRFHLAGSTVVTLVPEQDVIMSSIPTHPGGIPTLSDVQEIARLVRAEVFVDVSADAAPDGLGGVALIGAPRPHPLRVDTLRASGASSLDSVARTLASRIVARTGRSWGR